MPRHATDLFSQAYERELRGDERERFETHLASCSQCHDAYADYRAGIDALRAMPKATMPVAVHLPSTPPVAASPGVWDRVRALPGALRATTAAALVAAAIVGGVSLTSRPAATTALSTAPSGSNGEGGANLGVTAPQPTPLPAAPNRLASCTPSALDATGSASAPTGFGAKVDTSDPGRPTQVLTLATTSSHVNAGSTVLVYARLTAPVAGVQPPGGTASAGVRQSLPCVTLITSNQAPMAGNSVAAPGVADAQSATRALVEAQPTFDIRVGGIPLQSVTIPAGLPKGSVISLVATVPSEYPSGAGATVLTATLTLTVD